ncbi:MAG: glutamine-hydrolyzing GMP synthase [Clostridia bacterium]|nr:glutamine-hydrolyzing GMP synthase [Clostridia bacterium]
MEKIVILDCGGQYTKVIDRKIRELGVYTDLKPMGVLAKELEEYNGVVLSGGPSSVWSEGAPEFDRAIFDLGKPTLGICYGMQLICDTFGGVVAPGVKTEYGQVEIDVDPSCPLFKGLSKREKVLMSHGDAVKKLPGGFSCVASTGGVVAGISDEKRKIYGVQFHPEVDLTEHGITVFENFLRGVCRLKETYALEDRIETSVNMIRSRVGKDGRVVVLVSGGVDSAVTAALLCRALDPDQVYGIHIDHGLMRAHESDAICENLAKLGLKHMKRINAEDAFFHTPLVIDGKQYKPLCETTDPEEKRAIIGQMFFEVTEEAAKELHLDFTKDFLAQGTLRPDLIESGNPDVSGYAHKIKTHHNDVGVIRRLRDAGRVIETNWDWHKDEVRRVARMLGLDEEIAMRQPFPGPGLGVRMICCDRPEPLPPLEETDALSAFVKERTGGRLSAEIGPIRSVGVQGDCRSYKQPVFLYDRANTPPEDLNWEEMMQIARDIPNRFPFVNRVAFCLSGSANGLTHCDGMHISRQTADLLRQIDSAAIPCFKGAKIAQSFAVLFPVSKDPKKSYSCALRAVCTSDFMTAVSARPGRDFDVSALYCAVDAIKRTCGAEISNIYYDLTGKPPATVEWE